MDLTTQDRSWFRQARYVKYFLSVTLWGLKTSNSVSLVFLGPRAKCVREANHYCHFFISFALMPSFLAASAFSLSSQISFRGSVTWFLATQHLLSSSHRVDWSTRTRAKNRGANPGHGRATLAKVKTGCIRLRLKNIERTLFLCVQYFALSFVMFD